MLLEVEVNYLALDGSQEIWRKEIQSNYCKMSLKVKREKEIKILQHQTAGKSQWSVQAGENTVACVSQKILHF